MPVRTIHTKRHKWLVARIRQEREARDLIQETVAKRLKMTRPGYINLEAGQRRIDIVEYTLIAEAIGFDPVKVLRGMLKVNGPGAKAAGRGANAKRGAGPARLARGAPKRAGR